MKRLMTFTFALLICLLFAACGNEPVAPANTSVLPTAQPTAEPTAAPPAEATIQSGVIYDADGVKVTAKSLSLNGLFGPEINVLIENDTDKNLTIQAQNASVNGFMAETIFSADVPAGKKANDTIVFEQGSLEASGIEKMALIEFSLNIFRSDTWDDYANSEMISIPTSIADSYTQPVDKSGTVVLDESGITVIAKGIDYDGWLGPEVVFYIENNTEKNVTVQANSVSVNGFVVNPIFSSDVLSGKKTIDSMTIMDSEMEDNDIKTISEIEFTFNVFDTETYDDILNSGVITLSFE